MRITPQMIDKISELLTLEYTNVFFDLTLSSNILKFINAYENELLKAPKLGEVLKETDEFMGFDREEQGIFSPAKLDDDISLRYVSKFKQHNSVVTYQPSNKDYSISLKIENHFAVGIFHHLMHGGRYGDENPVFFDAAANPLIRPKELMPVIDEVTKKLTKPDLPLATEDLNAGPWRVKNMNISIFPRTGKVFIEKDHEPAVELKLEYLNDESIQLMKLENIFNLITNFNYEFNGSMDGKKIDGKRFTDSASEIYLLLKNKMQRYEALDPQEFSKIDKKIRKLLDGKTVVEYKIGPTFFIARKPSTAKLHRDILRLLNGEKMEETLSNDNTVADNGSRRNSMNHFS